MKGWLTYCPFLLTRDELLRTAFCVSNFQLLVRHEETVERSLLLDERRLVISELYVYFLGKINLDQRLRIQT